MTPEQAIFAYLAATAGVTAIVGSGADCRLYADEVEEGTARPHAWYEVANEERPLTFGATVGLARAELNVISFGDTKASAIALDAAIYTALHGFTGLMGGAGGVRFQEMLFRDRDRGKDEAAVLWAVQTTYSVTWET